MLPEKKAIGVSNYQVYHLENLLNEATVVPAVNQIECYPYLAQKELVDYCRLQGIRAEAWGPLGAGKSDVLSNIIITGIAKKHDKTPAQIVLRWNVQRGVIVIPKSVHENRLVENLNITGFNLTTDEMNQINGLDKNLRLGANPDNFDF